jgi:hypothetical protein
MILLGHGHTKHGQHVLAQHRLEPPLIVLHRGLRQGIETRQLAVVCVGVPLGIPR